MAWSTRPISPLQPARSASGRAQSSVAAAAAPEQVRRRLAAAALEGAFEHGARPAPALSGHVIKSPMVGTFYTAASPADPPFVHIGASVNEDSVVCIIEAMKVMNEVKAGKSGEISQICVDNGQPVEFGTELFKIKK